MEPEQGYEIVIQEICEVSYRREPIVAFKYDYSVDYDSNKYSNIEIMDRYNWHKKTNYENISVHNYFGESLKECYNGLKKYFNFNASNEEDQRMINETYRNEFEKYLKRSLVFKISYLIALAYVIKDNNHNINIPNLKILNSNNQDVKNILKEYSLSLEIQIRNIMDYN
jgi:hypothetical protein